MGVRDNKKMGGKDSKTAMANGGAVYVPATFMHTGGGMGHIMKKHIVTTFRHAPSMALQLYPDYKTVLNYAAQTMTATISSVNAKANYLIKNMRRS